MGLLAKLFTSPAAVPRHETVDLSGRGRVAVVGESHYQPALARIAGPKVPGGVELECRAVLTPEPDNPYDPNAIAVSIGGGQVGYLSREDAQAYRMLVSHYARKGTVTCEAVVLGGDAGRGTQFCVWLHIREP